MALLGLWLIGGLYLDGWAHNHIPSLETFFTPWHGVLYSGFLVQAAILAGLFVRNWRRGGSFTTALPQGYGLSLIGAGLFTLGGVGDMLWHVAFGIEIGVEALLSPTHIFLALGGALLITGPIRAALARADSAGGSFFASLPLIISATTFYSTLTFFTVYANPYGTTWITLHDRPAPDYTYVTNAIGITSVLFQSALLAAIVLFLIRNSQLRPGHLTLLLAINTGATAYINDVYLNLSPLTLFLTGLGAGVVGDLLLWRLKPSLANVRALRTFAFALPAALYLFYFLAAFTVGIWWTIHFWTGAIVLAGISGWLVSYLLVPSSFERVFVSHGPKDF